mmetsp:Transcript_8513/g.20434  ORF Transcript_8513/g.20434 Transcript_8513/m.20434 type:complete len:288 (-) Transcript_8513:82-945(-)
MDSCEEAKGEADANRDRDGVLCIRLHPLEDLTGASHSINDDTEALLGQNDVSSGPRRIRRPGDSNANIGFAQGGRVVDAIASHSADMPLLLLQPFNNLILVLREHLRKAVGLLDQVIERHHAFHQSTRHALLDHPRREHVVSHPELARCLLANRELIPCDHLHANTQLKRPVNRLLRVVPRGVEQRDKPHKLPGNAFSGAMTVRDSDAERAVSARGVLKNPFLHLNMNLLEVLRQRQDHLRGALCNLKLTVFDLGCPLVFALPSHEGNSALADWIKRRILDALKVIP